MCKRSLFLAFFVVTSVPVVATPAAAHRLHATWEPRDKLVRVRAFYDGRAPAVRALVQIKNTAGDIIAEGRTDAKGIWEFPNPGRGRFYIRVNDGAGHVVSRTISEGTRPPVALPPVAPGGFPWLKIGVGVGAIGILCLALLIAVRQRKSG